MRVIFRENTPLRGPIDKTWQPLAAVVIRLLQARGSGVGGMARSGGASRARLPEEQILGPDGCLGVLGCDYGGRILQCICAI
jgi:hypothetical protein